MNPDPLQLPQTGAPTERRGCLFPLLFLVAFWLAIGVAISCVAAPRPASLIPAAPTTEREPDLGRRTGAPRTLGMFPSPSVPAPPAAAGLGVRGGGAPPRPMAAPVALMSVSGIASWYATDGLSAAAGPALRVGDWRGRIVTVTGPAGTLAVTLAGWCQCLAGTSRERLIDLSDEAFRAICGPLSRGLCEVEVEHDR